MRKCKDLVLAVLLSLLPLIDCLWIPGETGGDNSSGRVDYQMQSPRQGGERSRGDPLIKARIIGGDVVKPKYSYPWMVSSFLLHLEQAEVFALGQCNHYDHESSKYQPEVSTYFSASDNSNIDRYLCKNLTRKSTEVSISAAAPSCHANGCSRPLIALISEF